MRLLSKLKEAVAQYLVVVAKNLDQIEGMSVEESRATLHELMLPGLGGEPQVLGAIDEATGLTTSRTVFNPGAPRDSSFSCP